MKFTKKMMAFLMANGLREGASTQEALDKLLELKADGITLPDELVEEAKQATEAPPAPAPAPAAEPVDVDAAVKAALKTDAQRRATIEERLAVAGITDAEFRNSLVNDETMTEERATTAIFEYMKTQNPPVGNTQSSVHVGTEARDKFRSAARDAILARTGIRLAKPVDGVSELRGMRLVDICREALELTGTNTRGMRTMDLIARALSPSSTSDFPALMLDVANKHLLNGYDEWPRTFQPFVSVGSASDFKSIYVPRMSGSPDLQPLGQNGEYRTAHFADASENYRIITKGIMAHLTRQMVINDDLRAFTAIPARFGSAAARWEADAVYSLLTSNPDMSDGTALFHADHNNLGANADVDSTGLDAARAGMRKQTGLKGEKIDVHPAFILVPVALETSAEILLRSAALPDADMSAGVHNPWAGKLTPVADPRLDTDSTTAWYTMAHPNQVPTIEVAYLEGEEQPYIEDTVDFDTDSLKIKVRHDFGAGLVDWVGVRKTAGV